VIVNKSNQEVEINVNSDILKTLFNIILILYLIL